MQPITHPYPTKDMDSSCVCDSYPGRFTRVFLLSVCLLPRHPGTSRDGLREGVRETVVPSNGEVSVVLLGNDVRIHYVTCSHFRVVETVTDLRSV